MTQNIVAVVVTYNRKALLKNVLTIFLNRVPEHLIFL